MGNQGKISRKQSSKMYVFLHISVLSFIFEKKLLLYVEKPLFCQSNGDAFLGLEWLRLIKTFDFNRTKNSCAHNSNSIDSKTLVNLEKRLLRILHVFRYQI